MGELISRLKKWQKGEVRGPLISQVHFTNRCNLSCDFCPTVASKEKGELDLTNELDRDKWIKIIEEGNDMEVKEWHICGGGEPLMDKKMALDLMSKMKESGARGEIITNGTLVDEVVAKKLIDIGWDLVTFSVDGPNKKTNDYIRSEDSFRKAVSNAKFLSSLRDDDKPYLVVHTVLCNKNYDKTEEMIELVDEMGFDEIRFNSMNVWNEAGEALELDSSKIKEAKRNLIEARKTAGNLGVKTNIKEFIEHNLLEHSNEIDEVMKEEVEDEEGKKFSNLSCYYPWYNISIFADGRVAPCFLFHDGADIHGKNLAEVWYGDYFDEIRERFLENKLKDVCKNCNAWNVEKMERIREGLKS